VVGKPILADARVKCTGGLNTAAIQGPQEIGAPRVAVLMNQGVHTVDCWFGYWDMVRVQARTATALHAVEVEDTAVPILEFASGALGGLQATTAAYPGYPRRVESRSRKVP
jgi:predicted dehydrogenase